MGLPKTLTLAGKVSRWRELAFVVDRRAGLSIHVCGGGSGDNRGDLRAEPGLVDAQEDPMVAI